MQRVSQKMLTEFIARVADLKPSNIPDDDAMCYYSKKDGSYFTREGMEKKEFKYLLKRGITEELQGASGPSTVSLGFNPKENKWYGWSHRAIYGFGIGSTCKPGNCHYRPSNKKDFLEDCIRFWSDENHLDMKGKECMNENGELGIEVSWTQSNKTPNSAHELYPDEFGKGEWTAETMEDAKEMAIDFANGVS